MWCGMISERAGSIDGTVARGGGWGTYLDSVSESTLASASPPAGVALSTASSFDPLTLLVTNKRIGGAGNVDGSIAVDTAKGAAQGGGCNVARNGSSDLLSETRAAAIHATTRIGGTGSDSSHNAY